MTEKEKMQAGEWYSCHDPELLEMQARARMAVYEHNTQAPDLRGAMGAKLRHLMAHVGEHVLIEAPFHCAMCQIVEKLRTIALPYGTPHHAIAA